MFYLKDPSKPISLIQFTVSVNGKNFKYSAGESVDPSFWNKDTHRISTNYLSDKILKKRYRAINSRLDEMQLFYDQICDNARLNRTFLNREVLFNEFEKKYKLFPAEKRIIPDAPVTDFYILLQNFIDLCENGKITTRKGVLISTQRISHYKTFKKNILLFRPELDINDIDLVLYNDYIAHRSKCGSLDDPDKRIALNTIGKEINILKAFMHQGYKRKWHSNEVFKDVDFKTFEETIGRPYFDDFKLDKLWSLDLSEYPRLQRPRDEYIVYCYTGFRVSDSTKIASVNILKEENLLKIVMKKTKEVVYIPIHWRVLELIERYGEIPNRVKEYDMNYHIRDICRIAGFDKPFIYRKTVGGATKTFADPEWKLYTNHSARRTAATNMIKAGMAKKIVMILLGIKSDKAFDKYCCISQQEAAEMISENAYFRKPVGLLN